MKGYCHVLLCFLSCFLTCLDSYPLHHTMQTVTPGPEAMLSALMSRAEGPREEERHLVLSDADTSNWTERLVNWRKAKIF